MHAAPFGPAGGKIRFAGGRSGRARAPRSRGVRPSSRGRHRRVSPRGSTLRSPPTRARLLSKTCPGQPGIRASAGSANRVAPLVGCGRGPTGSAQGGSATVRTVRQPRGGPGRGNGLCGNPDGHPAPASAAPPGKCAADARPSERGPQPAVPNPNRIGVGAKPPTAQQSGTNRPEKPGRRSLCHPRSAVPGVSSKECRSGAFPRPLPRPATCAIPVQQHTALAAGRRRRGGRGDRI